MAWIPSFIIALAKWRTLGQFVLIAATLTTIHVLAINLIAPKLVGRRVRLNAVAITIALLFWGWVWGGMGLVLAIPITATLRVICDHTESWKPIGRWLSARNHRARVVRLFFLVVIPMQRRSQLSEAASMNHRMVCLTSSLP